MTYDRRLFLKAGLGAVTFAGLGFPGWALADSAGRGREIAEKADRLERGFHDFKTTMVMLLHDRHGRETKRELETFTLETSNGGQKSLIYFQSPRDIRGTALLTHSEPGKDDEQWLYLPAIRRTKRIATSGRSSPFMGSEFYYEDLVTSYPSQYSYRFVKEESLRGIPSFVVERVPRYAGTGYKRETVWYDQKEYRVTQIEFWDRRERHLKTLSLGGYRKYLDKFWQPTQARMLNHLANEATELIWKDYQFHAGLTENDFNRNALGRVR